MNGLGSEERSGAAVNLVNDHVTGALVGGLRQRGLRAIVLKGASVRHILYGASAERVSYDIDALVASSELASVEAALPGLGFRRIGVSTVGAGRDYRATWQHDATSLPLELHTTITGVGASSVEVWEVLGARTESMEIGGVLVDVLDEPARVFHVALHVAQHGRADTRILADLDRALSQVSPQIWRDAAILAARLDALSAFVAGVRLDPRGRALLDQLELVATTTPEIALRAETAPPLSQGLAWLSQLPSTRDKARFVLRTTFPPRDYIRVWSPVARRGRLGLVIAYCWRPLWMAVHIPAALRAWRRATLDSRL